MSETEIRVTFQPQGRNVFVLRGSTLLEAAAEAGITLNTPCGGRGTCGKCKVRVSSGAAEPGEAERATLDARELAEGFRLACQTHVDSSMVVEVPESSVLASTFQILTEMHASATKTLDAEVRKVFVSFSHEELGGERPFVDQFEQRLRRKCHLGKSGIGLDLIRSFARHMGEKHVEGTAVISHRQLIDFEKGDTSKKCFSIAMDIGTTTLAAVLLDLNTGKERASVARMNPQTRYGDDVISRIEKARQGSTMLTSLQKAVVEEVNGMIKELISTARVQRSRIYEAVFAGNTTMQQIFAGVDPSALGEYPFPPVTGQGLSVQAKELRVRIHGRGSAYLFPVIGGFVGGDTVAGILATSLPNATGPTLLVDIGTNGEIVVFHDGHMLAASTAAGPAFEGARIMHGMRATVGAIEKVVFKDDVKMNVIGNAAPAGICGSALIDVVAELLRHGMLISQGMLLGEADVPDTVPQALRERLIATEDGAAFVLARADETSTGKPVLLTQKDIREVQLATAAIRTGVTILMKRVGLGVGDIERVLVAGGFGNFIRRSNAQRIGLLPGGLEHERIVYVGNTSLAGARMAAVSRKAREKAEQWARQVRHVDLSRDVDFRDEYVNAMFFPEQE